MNTKFNKLFRKVVRAHDSSLKTELWHVGVFILATAVTIAMFRNEENWDFPYLAITYFYINAGRELGIYTTTCHLLCMLHTIMASRTY